MGETNNNNNNSGNANNGNEGQQGHNNQNNSQQQNQNNQNMETNLQRQQNELDVKKISADAKAELLKSLGYESEEDLSNAVSEYKKHVDSQKTDVQKAQDDLSAVTKELAQEREARILAEAKYEAVSAGVKPGLVDDVVLIAKSRVTKEKDISQILSEMKENENEKIYFSDSESESSGEERNKNSNSGNSFTRKRPGSGSSEKKKDGGNNSDSGVAGKYAGTMAARLFAKEKTRNKESSYFGRR